jgi:hypothetical protein
MQIDQPLTNYTVKSPPELTMPPHRRRNLEGSSGLVRLRFLLLSLREYINKPLTALGSFVSPYTTKESCLDLKTDSKR